MHSYRYMYVFIHIYRHSCVYIYLYIYNVCMYVTSMCIIYMCLYTCTYNSLAAARRCRNNSAFSHAQIKGGEGNNNTG